MPPIKSKSLYSSKTFWVNALTALIAAGTGLLNAEWIAANPGVTAALVTGLSMANVFLRYITNQPVEL